MENKVLIQLTNHQTTILKQINAFFEEVNECHIELWKGEELPLIDELIDVAKSGLKLAKQLCEQNGLDFNIMLESNNEKNEKRGYHE